MRPMKVKFYTKENCPLCDEGLAVLNLLKSDFELEMEEIDIHSDDQLLEAYMLKVPVVQVDGQELDYGQISWVALRERLQQLARG